MATDYDSGLPIRSEADGDDERVQVKIVDATDPDNLQMEVDSDNNAHVEIHGNDEGGVDRVVITNEVGNIALEGDYDAVNNTNPSSAGLVAHDRNVAHDRTTLNQRVTAVAGESEVVALDVSLHDELGNPYDADNPIPVSIEESEGDEIHAFEETEDVVKKGGTADHEYTVATGKTLLLYKVLSSGSAKMKIELQIGNGASSEVFATKAVTFNSTANPQADITFDRVPIKVVGTADTTTVKVIVTNRDNQDQDIHTTIVGIERNT